MAESIHSRPLAGGLAAPRSSNPPESFAPKPNGVPKRPPTGRVLLSPREKSRSGPVNSRSLEREVPEWERLTSRVLLA